MLPNNSNLCNNDFFFSIICSYNDENILHDNLLRSLNNQSNVRYEIILVDGNQIKFKSAAQALNYGASKAKGSFLIFSHQDIRFLHKDTLFKLSQFCKEYSFGIAGVAGLAERNGHIAPFSKIVHGESKNIVVDTVFDQPMQAISLDECFFIIPRRLFNNFRFRYLGNTWHLYATDFLLQVTKEHYNAYIVPISLWHLSAGNSLNVNYFDAVQALSKLERNNRRIFYTLYGKWPTNFLLIRLKCFYRKSRLIFWGK